MANVTLGEQAYTELPSRRTYDPKRGWQTQRRFKGSSASIATLAATLQSDGYSTELTEGPAHELVATIGVEIVDGVPVNPDEVQSVWEIQGSAGEVELLRSPLADSITEASRKILKDLSKGTSSFENGPIPASADTSAVTMYKLMADGMTSRRIHYPTLRNTETAPAGYIFPNELSGVTQIFSTSRLISGFAIPQSIRNQMPDSSLVTRNGLNFYYGWMYQYPSVTVTNGNKSVRVKEWEWGLWPANIYTYNA